MAVTGLFGTRKTIMTLPDIAISGPPSKAHAVLVSGNCHPDYGYV